MLIIITDKKTYAEEILDINIIDGKREVQLTDGRWEEVEAKDFVIVISDEDAEILCNATIVEVTSKY